jgi:hypothetical protein
LPRRREKIKFAPLPKEGPLLRVTLQALLERPIARHEWETEALLAVAQFTLVQNPEHLVILTGQPVFSLDSVPLKAILEHVTRTLKREGEKDDDLSSLLGILRPRR